MMTIPRTRKKGSMRKLRRAKPAKRSCCDHRDRESKIKCTNAATYISRSQFVYCDTHYKPFYGGHAVVDTSEHDTRFREHLAFCSALASAKRDGSVLRLAKGPTHDTIPGTIDVHMSIKTCQTSMGICIDNLSVDKLGPIKLKNGSTCNIFKNFILYNFVYGFEVSRGALTSASFYEKRSNGYQMSSPKKRKLSSSFVDVHESLRGPCDPVAFVWDDPEGAEMVMSKDKAYTYLFKLYEQTVRQTSTFKDIKASVDKGYNIRLVSEEFDDDERDLRKVYKSNAPKLLFHIAIAFMLDSDDTSTYPWNA